MSEEESERLDRRKFLAGVGAVGAVSVAGCVGEPSDNSTAVSTPAMPDRPETPPLPDNEYWRYVVESLDYQNRVLERLDGGK